MSFYKELSRYYDEIFPVDEAEMAFVKGLLPDQGRLLDLGCGTGNKTVLLGESFAVTAVDADAAMIAQAKANNARYNINYTALDMQSVGTEFAGQLFDVALCLGNTLVHLPDAAAIQLLCGNVFSLLDKGGLFLIQVLHYDRIIREKDFDLPSIETPAVGFYRSYAFAGDSMHFVTTLEVKESDQVFQNSIPLYPLGTAELIAALGAAGFDEPRLYGSYQGAPHTDDSFVTIAVCRKP